MTRPTLLLIHGIGCDGAVWDTFSAQMQALGWSCEAPTLFPEFRVREAPTGQLSTLSLNDYVEAMKAHARRIGRETGEAPVLVGHSMGGLIVQKLLEHGVGAAGVLVTPAQPVDCQVQDARVLFTFLNVALRGDPKQAYKVWRTGFVWGVLNCVPRERHDEIYAQALYDSGMVYRDIAKPAEDPHRIAVIDETRIDVPVLTIGATRDRATVIEAVRKVARKYARIGGDYREYADAGHWIIDEPATPRLVEDVDAWLKRKGLAG
jgi:alpha-beta hydrolase superfamily lysophospholipase